MTNKGWYGNRQAHSLASKGIKTGQGNFNFESNGLKEKFKLQENEEQKLFLKELKKEMVIGIYSNLIEGESEQEVPVKYLKVLKDILEKNASILGITNVSKEQFRNIYYVEHSNGNILKIYGTMFTDDSEIMIDSFERHKRNMFNKERAIEELELRNLLDVETLRGD